MRSIIHQKLKDLYLPISIALISKAFILFLIPWLSIFILPGALASSMDSFNLWRIWDANSYLMIVQNGYQNTPEAKGYIVFYPLYPFLVSAVHEITKISTLYSGYIVSGLATIILAAALYKLVLLDFSKRVAVNTVFFLFIFPTSFFLHIPFAESLFLVLVVSSFILLRKKSFWLAFILGALACATRVHGLALIPAFIMELLIYERLSVKRQPLIMVAAMIVPLLGFLVYLMVNQIVFSNPFQFVIEQRDNWLTGFNVYIQGMTEAVRGLSWRQGGEKLMIGYAQIGAFLIGLFSLIYSFYKVRLSYSIYMLAAFLISISQSFWLSQPRYLLALFPLFIILALLAENDFFKLTWVPFSIILLTIFSLIAIQGGPIM